MDIEYYIKAIFEGGYSPHRVNKVMGKWRWHKESKTMTKGLAYAFRQDEVTIAERYKKYLPYNELKIIQHDINREKRWIFLRKLSFDYSQRKQPIPLLQLLKGLIEFPGLLLFRPWFGELRRTLFAQ